MGDELPSSAQIIDPCQAAADVLNGGQCHVAHLTLVDGYSSQFDGSDGSANGLTISNGAFTMSLDNHRSSQATTNGTPSSGIGADLNDFSRIKTQQQQQQEVGSNFLIATNANICCDASASNSTIASSAQTDDALKDAPGGGNVISVLQTDSSFANQSATKSTASKIGKKGVSMLVIARPVILCSQTTHLQSCLRFCLHVIQPSIVKPSTGVNGQRPKPQVAPKSRALISSYNSMQRNNDRKVFGRVVST